MAAYKKASLPTPDLSALHPWELYSSALGIEYRQSLEEGLDVEKYADLFRAVEALPTDNIDAKEKLADPLLKGERELPHAPLHCQHRLHRGDLREVRLPLPSRLLR